MVDEGLMTLLSERAAREGVTLPELIEPALWRILAGAPAVARLEELPTFHGGEPLVDVADRDALYQAMEERE